MDRQTGYNCSPERRKSQTGAFATNHEQLMLFPVIAVIAVIAVIYFMNAARSQRTGCIGNLIQIASGEEKEIPECPVEQCSYTIEKDENITSVRCLKGDTHLLFDLHVVSDRGGWRFVQDLPGTLPPEKTVITDRNFHAEWNPEDGKALISIERSFWRGTATGMLYSFLAVIFIAAAVYSGIMFRKEREYKLIVLLVLSLGLTVLLVYGSVYAFAGKPCIIVDSAQGIVTEGTGCFGKRPDPGRQVEKPLAFIAFRLKSGPPLLYLAHMHGEIVDFNEIGPVSEKKIRDLTALMDAALQKNIAGLTEPEEKNADGEHPSGKD